MAEVKVPYPETGLAAFEVLDEYTAGFLLSGSDPKLEPGYPLPIADGTVLEQFAVVGLSGGFLVMANNTTIKPIGVVTQAVTGAGGDMTVPVFFSGNFNPEALVWDASFDTMQKKINAFFGSPSPTRILIRERG